jgi:transcriptional regulator with GAF, ATPase, and Fis domain
VHDWPGNIRELQNCIERAVLFSPGSVRRLADADREHILETLEKTDWMIGGEAGAANQPGLPRTTLIYKMRSSELKHTGPSGRAPLGRSRMNCAMPARTVEKTPLSRTGGGRELKLWTFFASR